MDKRGKVAPIIWIVISAAVILLLILIGTGAVKLWKQTQRITWLDNKEPNIPWNGPLGWALTFISGITKDNAPTYSALIVLIAVWLIFFLAFGDMIAKFGFFSEGVAWVIGLALSVILANFGFYYNLLINFMSLFSFLAALSVIASLASIFFAMFVVHWGISGLAPWIQSRRIMMNAALGRTQVEEGVKIAAAIGRAAAREGRKK